MIWDRVIQFLIDFFLYVPDGNGGYSIYSDNLGEGAFGYRHLLWMAAVVFLVFLMYGWAKRHPAGARRFVIVFSILLFGTRLTHQIVRAVLGVENPWTQAFPFHMCTVLTFVMPVVAAFDLKSIKAPVFVLGIMGGVITILNGDYFGSRFLNFGALEGMSAHMLLILIPVAEMGSGRFRLRFSESWKVIVGILVLMGWATLANRVFYKGLDANYMYLEHNALPFGNDTNFRLFYVLIFGFFFGCLYGLPPLFRSLSERLRVRRAA